MAQKQEKRFRLVNVPSKFDTSVSLFKGGNGERATVKFYIQDGAAKASVEVILDGCEREDGSGNNWMFKGYFVRFGMRREMHKSPELQEFLEHIKTWKKLHGYFDMESRTGWIASGYGSPRFEAPRSSK